MNSANAKVEELHRVYLEAMAIEPEDMPMTTCFERWWIEAIASGITADHIRIAVKERLAFNRKGGFQRGTGLRHLIRSDEDIAIVIEDYAAWKAKGRIKVMDAGKAEVLRQTHRPATLPETNAVPVGETELMKMLRKAAS